MELENFLHRLLDFGCSNYFNIKAIGQLDKGCCPEAKTEVIDFDETKEKVCQTSNLHTLKSCDALKFLPELERLDFIELKGFKKFIEHLKPNVSNSQQIDKQIIKFDLVTKIYDSNYVLYSVLNKNNHLNKSDKTHYLTVEKNYIILIDIELEEQGIQNMAITLEFLSETSTPIEKQIASKIKTEINDINTDLVPKLNQPMLKSCKDIDNFYKAM